MSLSLGSALQPRGSSARDRAEDAHALPTTAAHPAHPASVGAARKTSRYQLEAAHWHQARMQLERFAPAAPVDALLVAACGTVTGLWINPSQFSLAWIDGDERDAEGPAPEEARRITAIAFDLTGNETFGALVQRVGSEMRALTSTPRSASIRETAAPVAFVSRSARALFATPATAEARFAFQAIETKSGDLVVDVHHAADEDARAPGEALMRWLHALATAPESWSLATSAQAAVVFPPDQAHRRAEVNGVRAPVSEDRLFSGFLRQVAQAPDRAAVIAPDQTLSYGELHRRAGALAHVLRGRGVRAGELVAIAANRGWEQVAAALGITLAGAAYLPLDAELPGERLRVLLECADARFVIVPASDDRAWPASVECLSWDRIESSAHETSPPDEEIPVDRLAYVIFTSGSTGMPKGVMIDHRGAVNTIVDMNSRFRVGAEDRVLALSRLGFDLSVYDIFGLLAVGGAIVLPDASLARDPAHWADLIAEHKVTLWNTVPALMQLLVDHADSNPASTGSTLRMVWMSGDWIPMTLPGRIRGHFPAAEIVSLGGATEASIWSIYYPIGAVDPAWRSIPYGWPLTNQTFHVLHENLTPCPDGVPGELYIGGIGVALGYWKEPAKTAERFIVHPQTRERLYRTGDLGRYLDGGLIEFLGRADFQVKIRGFRIELGEIEAALTRQPGVRRAVVVARGESDADRQLVAYVVLAPEGNTNPDTLRRALGVTLPGYMVPAAIVVLDHLPLTANGKVDIRALPPPAAASGVGSERDPATPPEGEIEEIVLQTWQSMLPAARFGVLDDFFALGGTSLSGTRMIIRLREAFALPLSVQSLYEHPTIRDLAAHIEEQLLADLSRADGAG